MLPLRLLLRHSGKQCATLQQTQLALQQQQRQKLSFVAPTNCYLIAAAQRALLQRKSWLFSPNNWQTTHKFNYAKYLSSNNRNIGCKSGPDKQSAATTAATHEQDLFSDANKLGLFAKFKLMYKKYWYVLIPVHVVTSACWFSGFYYMSVSGVDVPALLELLHVSDTIIEKMQNSKMGHLAIAYLCYKIATPLRYAVTLGGTTVSIKHLVQRGYIKPVPTKTEFLQLYEAKKAERAAAKLESQELIKKRKN